ncbi:DUF6348 family protein [Myxococcus xanthus]|uniref:Uncharacterized protein n=1 Tax=Myxococcus xanthus TaxID=34 RepID=A0A7Y4IQU0_MYXXA|nr:DUF6348 family protein [Myxococcus xanthus]NOJ83748.1 hypothetical protein [Myxococcus xanthus]NOJ91080.1 hypothetical protein [Myxococcus xanthus]
MEVISATESLRDLLEAHDVPCHVEGEWLRLGESGPRVQGWYIYRPNANTERSVRLDVVFELWPGRVITESFSCQGDSRDDAQRNVIESFSRSSLHVLLSAFLNVGSEYIQVEEWGVGGSARQVFLGEVVALSSNPSDVPEPAWLTLFEDAVKSLPLAPGTHWVRIYFAQLDARILALEVLLDNEEWPELKAGLERAPWPRAQGLLSNRLFLVLQGGVDVSRAVATFVEHADQPVDVIQREIQAQGASLLEAEKLVAYIPEAFGAACATNVGAKVPESVQFVEWNGSATYDVVLAQDPLWLEASRLAKRTLDGRGLSEDQLDAIINRSVLLDKLDVAIAAGAKPEIVVLGPFTIALTEEGTQAMRLEAAERASLQNRD